VNSRPMDPFRSPARGALHDYMADLAEEVTLVDLRDRVRTSSRRATVRRRVLLTSSAAVAVVAIAAGVAWAGQPRQGGHEVNPATSESPVPSAAPSSPPSSASSTAPMPQRLFYLSLTGKLLRKDGGELFAPRTKSCGLVLSPDRNRIAYVVADGGGATGDLIVARPDGTGKKTVLHDVTCTGGNSHGWLPGSRKILLRQGNTAKRVVVDVQTATISESPLATVNDYLAWSPNGDYVAYAENGEIVVARPDGTVVHRVAHGEETPTGGFSVQGVTDDGQRVVVGMMNSDPGFVRAGFRVVDVVRGTNIALAVVPEESILGAAIHPLPGNNLLVRIEAGSGHKLYLVGADGQVLDSRTEPAGLRTATLIAPY
jgi:hypothetical protein